MINLSTQSWHCFVASSAHLAQELREIDSAVVEAVMVGGRSDTIA